MPEIHGRPGQVWGSVVIPASGKATMRIVGDTLHTSTKTSYGLEKKEIHTRIQNIDAVEVVEGRLWWLLFLGIATLLWVIGIVFIVLFFVLKQNWIVVHTPCSHLILFYKKSENVQGFCTNLLNLSRQLNAPAIPRQQPPAQATRPTNTRPAPTAG
ncbi:hypothetical protein C7B82_28590 [Stenomitos frigidus ULC18]|uniref:Uncharacterized protein n=2 Tax=Stenomitos TaxID=1844270 RepID=A0A2T1DU78_9CYAN|nr:hypothetical protein C7B82_28590 [Stenomitos frigidus ULC18]